MLFNSFTFLHFFLPVFLAVYFLVKEIRTKNIVLLLFSLIFYAWGEEELVLLLLLSSLVDFYAGKLIQQDKRKLGLSLSLGFNLSILFFFKYLDFVVENIRSLAGIEHEPLEIALPIGISFFTFQTMSYTIDVYRGKIPAQNDFLDFATYVCMFPQLIAGPIVRYADIKTELQSRTIDWNKISVGCERFIIGLAKKMLIANYFAQIADDVFNYDIASLSFYDAWLGIIAYTLQIYFDFSAYTDMAIGLGLILGFTFPENFNYPYVSKSIREFWRRWHMTMSFWFRDYVYISLGGNRVSAFRNHLNLFIVFVVTGLWHGASWNFIVWGLIHGTVIILERRFPGFFERIPSLLKWLYTFLVVLMAWVFFRADTIGEAFYYIKALLSFDFDTALFLRAYLIDIKFWIVLVIGLAFCSPFIWTRCLAPWRAKTSNKRILYYLLLCIVFALSIIYLSSASYDPFIYFRF